VCLHLHRGCARVGSAGAARGGLCPQNKPRPPWPVQPSPCAAFHASLHAGTRSPYPHGTTRTRVHTLLPLLLCSAQVRDGHAAAVHPAAGDDRAAGEWRCGGGRPVLRAWQGGP